MGQLREGVNNTAPSRVAGGDFRQNTVVVAEPIAAMKVAAFFSAVDMISNSIANLQLQLLRRDRALDYFKLNLDEPWGRELNYMLAVRPNDRLNAFQFMKGIVEHRILHGNAFVYPVMEGGVVTRLVLVNPGCCSFNRQTNSYIISDPTNGVMESYVPANRILHFKNISLDGGHMGVSTIMFAATVLGISATADRETMQRFSTGGRFKAIIQNDTSVKGFGQYQDEQLQNLASDLQDNIDAGKDIMVLKGDGKVTPISMSSTELQILENKKFSLRDIARFLHVPPTLLMDDGNANYKTPEAEMLAFYSQALQPIMTDIEREFNAKLIFPSQFGNSKFKFDLTALHALDTDMMIKWNKSRLETGQATVNDLRREDNMKPVEGGDTIYMSTNLAELGSEKLRGGSATQQTEEGGNDGNA